jgi:hypothetical protein
LRLPVGDGGRQSRQELVGQAQPATVAVRLPCPERVDVKGDDMIDLLLVTPDDAAEAGSWPTAVEGLAEDLTRWNGNHVHTLLRSPADAGGNDKPELHAAPWRLVAGQAPAGLPLTDDPAPQPSAHRPPSLRP